MAEALMQLSVFTPAETLIEVEARRLTARGPDGAFGILPHHVDIAAAVVPGIVAYVDAAGSAHYVAIDHGVLLKAGARLRIATRRAVAGRDLAGLRQAVEKEFLNLSDLERDARLALARLEAGVVRRFLDLQDSGRRS